MASKSAHEGNLERLAGDCRRIIEEHLPRVEEALLATEGKAAAISITIKWKPTEAGLVCQVDGKATLPAVGAERTVHLGADQMELL
jgi:hypothetical protein